MEEKHSKLVVEVSDIAIALLNEQWESLTEKEVLQLAVQIQKNRILSDAFGVTNIDKVPAYLEAIAIANDFNSKI